MKKCQKCLQEHDGSFGSGKFCSRACANSRTRSADTKKKISNSLKKYRQEHPDEKSGTAVYSKEEFEKYLQQKKLIMESRFLEKPFDEISIFSIRKRVLLEQGNKCNRCGLDEWFGQPLTLEMDHKDGDTKNNKRENLECLCPNCHSLTGTWRGRNKEGTGGKCKVSNDELCIAFIEHGNIRQALIAVGLAPKGSNYGRMKKSLTLAGISYLNKEGDCV